MDPELAVTDGRQHAHEAGNPEDEDGAGHGIVHPARADQTGFHDGGDAAPQAQAEQHGRGRRQEGENQRNNGLFRRDVFAETLAGRALKLRREGVFVF